MSLRPYCPLPSSTSLKTSILLYLKIDQSREESGRRNSKEERVAGVVRFSVSSESVRILYNRFREITLLLITLDVGRN